MLLLVIETERDERRDERIVAAFWHERFHPVVDAGACSFWEFDVGSTPRPPRGCISPTGEVIQLKEASS